jgi:hypothetical protein
MGGEESGRLDLTKGKTRTEALKRLDRRLSCCCASGSEWWDAKALFVLICVFSCPLADEKR